MGMCVPAAAPTRASSLVPSSAANPSAVASAAAAFSRPPRPRSHPAAQILCLLAHLSLPAIGPFPARERACACARRSDGQRQRWCGQQKTSEQCGECSCALPHGARPAARLPLLVLVLVRLQFSAKPREPNLSEQAAYGCGRQLTLNEAPGDSDCPPTRPRSPGATALALLESPCPRCSRTTGNKKQAQARQQHQRGTGEDNKEKSAGVRRWRCACQLWQCRCSSCVAELRARLCLRRLRHTKDGLGGYWMQSALSISTCLACVSMCLYVSLCIFISVICF